jgi:hypothetical protein
MRLVSDDVSDEIGCPWSRCLSVMDAKNNGGTSAVPSCGVEASCHFKHQHDHTAHPPLCLTVDVRTLALFSGCACPR